MMKLVVFTPCVTPWPSVGAQFRGGGAKVELSSSVHTSHLTPFMCSHLVQIYLNATHCVHFTYSYVFILEGLIYTWNAIRESSHERSHSDFFCITMFYYLTRMLLNSLLASTASISQHDCYYKESICWISVKVTHSWEQLVANLNYRHIYVSILKTISATLKNVHCSYYFTKR